MNPLSPAIAVLDRALKRLHEQSKNSTAEAELTVVIAVGDVGAVGGTAEKKRANKSHVAFLLALYPGATFARVATLKAVGGELAKYAVIDRLVIASHGNSYGDDLVGAMLYDDDEHFYTRLVQLPGIWKEANTLPKIRRRIEFVACSLARSPESLFRFGHALQALQVWAVNCFTSNAEIPFDDEGEAKKWMRAGRGYCLGLVDAGVLDEDLRGSAIVIGPSTSS